MDDYKVRMEKKILNSKEYFFMKPGRYFITIWWSTV